MLLQTERFTLSPLAEQDAALFQGLYRDEGLMRYIGDVMDEQRAEKAFRASLKATRATPTQFYFWVIEENQQPLGVAAVTDLIADWEAEPGIILLPEAQNKKVGLEVLRCLLNFCRDKLQLKRVVGTLDANNSASLKLIKKVGYCDFQSLAEATTGRPNMIRGYLHFQTSGAQL